MKLAVVLFNLGAPDSPAAVEPFLANLFSDPAILTLPRWLRQPLARAIAARRAPKAQAIYAHLGGCSPLLENTQAQANALERALRDNAVEAKVFVAMRAWHPMSAETARAVKEWAPDRIVLLPLYPQFSTTTSGSSVADWKRAAADADLHVPEGRVCCYPFQSGFIEALSACLDSALERCKPDVAYRVLFSAHGLPERIVRRGDPYQWQVEQTVDAVVRRISGKCDWRIAYQSRVGPMKWLEPATDAEIRRAGKEGVGIIVVPVAFVSEHSETLVELDIEYARLAKEAGIPDYIRAPTVGTAPAFIAGLARLVFAAVAAGQPVTCGSGRICPPGLAQCGFRAEAT